MGYCHVCGFEFPEGSVFCPKCGTRLVSTEGPAPNTAQTSNISSTMGSGNLSLGRKMILAGGIIAMIFSIWLLILSAFWTTAIQIMLLQMTGLPMSFLSYTLYFMFIGSFIGIATGLFSIYVASAMRKRSSKNSGLAAILTGVVMLFSGNAPSAALVVVGGLLCLRNASC
jgi:hypothetical protein